MSVKGQWFHSFPLNERHCGVVPHCLLDASCSVGQTTQILPGRKRRQLPQLLDFKVLLQKKYSLKIATKNSPSIGHFCHKTHGSVVAMARHAPKAP